VKHWSECECGDTLSLRCVKCDAGAAFVDTSDAIEKERNRIADALEKEAADIWGIAAAYTMQIVERLRKGEV